MNKHSIIIHNFHLFVVTFLIFENDSISRVNIINQINFEFARFTFIVLVVVFMFIVFIICTTYYISLKFRD